MIRIPDMSARATAAELMDDDACDEQTLFQTLDRFQTINRLFTPCHRLIRRHFVSRIEAAPDRQWSMLDVGAGGCDLPIWLSRLCKRRGLKLTITCLDDHESVVRYALSKTANEPNIEVCRQDALTLDPRQRKWDFVFTNHFLHHLSDAEVVQAISRMQAVCREAFVFCDIRRSVVNYIGFSIVAKAFLDHGFIYADGQLSIRKGFRLAELRQLLATSGDRGKVKFAPPGHLAITGTIEKGEN